MSGTWFCYNCDENIGDAEKCPYCGCSRNGVEDQYAPTQRDYAKAKKVLYGEKPTKRQKKEMFTDTEKLMFGLYPKGFKELLKLKVFGRK